MLSNLKFFDPRMFVGFLMDLGYDVCRIMMGPDGRHRVRFRQPHHIVLQIASVVFAVIPSASAISVCEKGGQWQQALSLLSDMGIANMIVDVVSFNAAIPACEKGGLGRQARF